MNRQKERKQTETSGALAVLRGALAAAALSVALVAAYAFVLQKQWLDIDSVPVANTVIKLLCAAFAALIAVRARASRLPLRGALAGAGYIVLTSLVFALISGEFNPGTGALTDVGMCAVCGAIVGMIRNLRTR